MDKPAHIKTFKSTKFAITTTNTRVTTTTATTKINNYIYWLYGQTVTKNDTSTTATITIINGKKHYNYIEIGSFNLQNDLVSNNNNYNRGYHKNSRSDNSNNNISITPHIVSVPWLHGQTSPHYVEIGRLIDQMI